MRIVSGMRPTGKLHLGHLLGALSNWIKFQNEGHECFYFVADFHALTSDFDKTADLQNNIEEMVIDWLAAGLDPEKSTIFVQSHLPQQPELFLLLSMITTMGWLERNPTYKELRQETTDKDLSNLGFFSYPVMQAADIAILMGEGVPVGQDQLPHLELTREIVRRFNHLYGQTFPEPQAILTSTPKILGTDGRKMSKSYNNSILLSDTEEEVRAKIQGMVTDTQRVRRQDVGNPDNCNLFPLHVIFTDPPAVQKIRADCTTAAMGCVDCKKILVPNLEATLKTIRERRKHFESNRALVRDILSAGAEKARTIAKATLLKARKGMNL